MPNDRYIPSHPRQLLKAALALLAGLFGSVAAFPQSAAETKGIVSIPLLAQAEMSPADARVAADHWTAIGHSARIYGYALDSSYTYKQIGCQLAPHHLLLAFEAVAAGGSISQFTAVVPRKQAGNASGPDPVQIVPITRFGATPFLPADKNPHTVEIFNRSVTPAPTGSALAASLQAGNDPLLIRSLCYLAMIGEAPNALRALALDPATTQAPVPTAAFLPQGMTQEVFSTGSSGRAYQVWALTFSPGGRLMKADREQSRPSPLLRASADRAPATPIAPDSANSPPAHAAPPVAKASIGNASPASASPASTSPGDAVSEDLPVTKPVSSLKPSQTPALPVPPPAAAPARSAVAARTDATPATAPTARFAPNPPPPPGHFIPDAAMPYPPQAPEK